MIERVPEYWAFAETVETIGGTTHVRLDLLKGPFLGKLGDLSKEYGDEVFRDMPIPIIAFEIPEGRRDEYFGRIDGSLVESVWYRLDLDRDGPPASRYSDLTAPEPEPEPVHIARMSSIDDDSPEGRLLLRIFSLSELPQGGADEVAGFLPGLSSIADDLRVGVYDVGQGNANAVCDDSNMPLLYFDLGGGCLRNASTYLKPKWKDFCWTRQPPVILSHWDYDHYFSGTFLNHWTPLTNNPWKSQWIVPDQRIGATAKRMLANIVNGGGSVLVWSKPPWIVQKGPVVVNLPTPKALNKNDSGIVLRLEIGMPHGAKWPVLLPGDIDYQNISSTLTQDLEAIVATHHGSKHYSGQPPASNGSGEIAYSFGTGNSFGHPANVAVNEHAAQGWNNRFNTPNGNIMLAPGPVPHRIPCPNNQCGLEPAQP